MLPQDKFLIKESDLKKHLKGELQKIDGNSTIDIKENKKDNKNIFTKKDLEKDNQLRTAADILKSLIILKGDKKYKFCNNYVLSKLQNNSIQK